MKNRIRLDQQYGCLSHKSCGFPAYGLQNHDFYKVVVQKLKFPNYSIVVCVILAFFLLTSASMWEGSAAVAAGSDLPEKGFFAATNSFPRNTVIDLTNLENNKSIRVIVAGNLETPGLLALISKEAAEIIGMNSGSISRIRMVQPSEPAAYLRFTEDNEAGIFNYDSGNVITEEKYRESIAVLNKTAVESKEVLSAYPQEIEWKPEWGNSYEIVDLFNPENELPSPAENDFFSELDETEDYLTEAEDEPELAEIFENEKESELIEEPVIVQIPQIIEEKKPETVYVTPNPEPAFEEIYEYTLVPAPQRPPEQNSIYGIDPSSIIPGIANVKETAVKETVPVVDIVPPFVNNFSFESLVVSNLKAGSFYVQIASIQAPELVEGILSRIDKDYRDVVCVQKSEQSAYRILLGPLNHGESGAILQRFKSIGYKDAFIRQIR
jgi:hypothetical protein